MAEASERQLPLRRAESAAAFVLVVQVLASGVALLLSRLSRSAAAEAEAWHLLGGVLVWLVALVHQRLRRLADEEALSAESLKGAGDERAGASLFEAEGADLLTARNRLEQFEKYFLPIFSALIAAVLGLLAYLMLAGLARVEEPPAVTEPLRNFWVFAGIAFVSFLLAKYTAGLATQAPWRPLRPGASYSMSCALGSLLVALALVFAFFEVAIVERVVAYAIPATLAVLSVETLLFLVLALYRPRVLGRERRAAHDSRLLGMLVTSRGILRTTAETLDYQFGFKVSETWFYRFMERALAPLILFQAATLYLLTCFVVVETGEQAVVERLGKPRHGTQPLVPGPHLKLPWPIDIVHRHPVERVEMLTIGEQLDEDTKAILWTVSHAKEQFFLLVANKDEGQAPAPEGGAEEAVPVSMLSGGVHVYYKVKSLYDYLYKYRDPKATLRTLCYRELTRYAVSADLLQFLAARRADALKALEKQFQDVADDWELGVQIVSVNLQSIHPPIAVGAAFEDVVGAFQDKQERVLRAEAYYNEVLPAARAMAERIHVDAATYKHRREVVSPARALRFEAQLRAYTRSPIVFRSREGLNAIEDGLGAARKYILPDWLNYSEVIILNLEEKLLPTFGLDLEGSEPEKGTRP